MPTTQDQSGIEALRQLTKDNGLRLLSKGEKGWRYRIEEPSPSGGTQRAFEIKRFDLPGERFSTMAYDMRCEQRAVARKHESIESAIEEAKGFFGNGE